VACGDIEHDCGDSYQYVLQVSDVGVVGERGYEMKMLDTFGFKVRQLRKNRGMSLREFAKKVEIDFSYLSKIETGKFPPPSDETIKRIAQVLDFDVDKLFHLAKRLDPELVQYLIDNPRLVPQLRLIMQTRGKFWYHIDGEFVEREESK
jgi:transcriptional regulator with XRE-family HTH domain